LNGSIKNALAHPWLAGCSHLFQALNFSLICDVYVFILSGQPGLHQNGSILRNVVIG
jgi:hypothetical protein